MSRRGHTIVELVVGVAVMATIGLVLAGLFRAGIKTYRYALRQNAVLASGRKAIQGDGPHNGIVWEAQLAQSLALSSGSVTVTPPSSPAVQFYVSGQSLFSSQLGSPYKQADGVTAVSTAYYNMNSATGRIMVSTAATSAFMITATLTLQSSNDRTYNFFTGARLRNQP